MKRFDELTQQELAQLAEEEVQNYVEFALMEEGIVVGECPMKPSLESVGITESEVVYRVGTNLFITREDATVAAGLKMCSTNYDYSGAGYDYKWTEPLNEVEIKEEFYYKEDDVKRLSSVLRMLKDKINAYNDAYDKYREATKKVVAIKERIMSVVWEAQEYMSRIEQAKKVFEKYKTLSGGDEEIAKKFFRNNFPEDMIKEVIGEDVEVADAEN